MGVTKDFIKATITDAMTPTFRRPMEDLIYETLDRRQIPTRTDFKELRDLVNNLRGQVSGSIQSVRSLHNKIEELEENMDDSESTDNNNSPSLAPIQEKLNQIEATIRAFDENSIVNRMLALEEKVQQQAIILQKLNALEEKQSKLEATLSPKTCIVPGCSSEVRSRGFCTSHYKKFRRGTLSGFINKDGLCKINKKKYLLPLKHEAQSFVIEDNTLVIGESRFLISDLKESTKDS